MSNKLGNIVLALLTVGLLSPVGTALADHRDDDDDRGRRAPTYTEAYWERYVARESRSYEREQEKEYARLERERARVEARLKKTREHLCKTLERLERRVGFDLSLPSFCEPVAPPSAPTLTLTALPTSIVAGASSTLTWASTNATLCIASVGWTGSKALSGTFEVAPAATTTYTLACGGAGGTTTKSVEVGVTALPPVVPLPTVDLTTASSTLTQGSSTMLSWTSTNALSCVAQNGWNGARATTGTESIQPSVTTTYVLECANASGATSSDTVTVTVVVPTPIAPTLTLTALPTSIVAGASSTLTWASTNATLCIASVGWTGSKALTGSLEVAPAATTTYTLACGGAGGTTTKSVEVGVSALPPVVPLPTVDLTASPLSVTVGGTSTLAWDSTNAVYCEASGDLLWTGTKAVSGSAGVTVSATTTYTLACGNETGTTTDSVEVGAIPVVIPALGKVVLSEFLYDLANDDSQGIETGNKNEWVELYNARASAVDLNGWYIVDASGSTSTLATTSTMLGAGKYVLVTNSTTTAEIWTTSIPPDTLIVVLPTSNKLTLNNSNEALVLYSPSAVEDDKVSWAGNTSAFNPALGTTPAGSSFARIPVTTDSDTSLDWMVLAEPTPGE